MTSGELVPFTAGLAHWECYTESVIGAAHLRQQKENQDAVDHYRDADGTFMIVAVADGHGGERYSRSKEGATFAVESAISVCRDLLASQPLETFWTGLEPKELKRVLCRRIVGEWNRLVGEDIALRGLPDNPEQDASSTRHRPGVQSEYIVYGSTLLTAIVTRSFALLTQIGDGDIVMASANGDISRPLEGDERSFANETCSLCMPDAWDEFRTGLIVFQENDPALFLLATDGYSNSFQADEDFQQVAKDIYRLLDPNDDPGSGILELKANLKTWLEETTQSGSGDDITIGLLYRADIPGDAEAT